MSTYRFLLIIVAVAVAAGCGHETSVSNITAENEVSTYANDSSPYKFDSIDPPETSPETTVEYPGRSIDQIFPFSQENDFSRGSGERKANQLSEAGFDIDALGFAPVAISRNGRPLLQLRTRSPKADYHSIAVGSAKLIGKDTNQIYIVSLGPGAVCCTNYWIVDVTEKQPKPLYRSEEFGRFRDPMEIFDFDGDGIYELMQRDSCFRYFMGDCGACSPEPRSYFKFDKATRQYRPASGLVEDFVKTANLKTEARVKERIANLKDPNDPVERYELDATVFSHFVDLLHQGRVKDGWSFFKKYHSKPSNEMLKEIRFRLANCQYYMALSKR